MGSPQQEQERRREFQAIRELLPYDIDDVVKFTMGRIVPEAAALLLEYRNNHIRALRENQYSPVRVSEKEAGSKEATSNVDIGVDRLMRGRLLTRYPEIVWFSEDSLKKDDLDPRLKPLLIDGWEKSPGPFLLGGLNINKLRDAPFLLAVVDSLDGSDRFNNFDEDFSFAIGFVYRGKQLGCVVHKPVGAITWWAVAGGGAYQGTEQIFVSETASYLKEATFATAHAWDDEYRQLTEDILAKVGTHYRQPAYCKASSVLDFTKVATGEIHGLAQLGLKPWDKIPISLVEEAGGRSTSIYGGPVDLFDDSLLSSSGRGSIHEDALRVTHVALLDIARDNIAIGRAEKNEQLGGQIALLEKQIAEHYQIPRPSLVKREVSNFFRRPASVIFSARDHINAGIKKVHRKKD